MCTAFLLSSSHSAAETVVAVQCIFSECQGLCIQQQLHNMAMAEGHSSVALHGPARCVGWHVCVHMCVCVCVCARVSVCECVYMCVCVSAHARVFVSAYVFLCLSEYICVVNMLSAYICSALLYIYIAFGCRPGLLQTSVLSLPNTSCESMLAAD